MQRNESNCSMKTTKFPGLVAYTWAVVITATALLEEPQACLAQRQHRCSGRIQYYPCGMEFPDGRTSRREVTERRNTVPARVVDTSQPQPYVEILNTSFSKTSARRGIWRGRMRGTGLIQPELRIYRGSALISSRPMGAVVLLEQETPFTFNSALPSGKDWSWRIVARARLNK